MQWFLRGKNTVRKINSGNIKVLLLKKKRISDSFIIGYKVDGYKVDGYKVIFALL